ncbi:MAG: carboxypeptidase regulatory-like domain-containing protein [Nanoarchaeota archaeon]|nr:carboxypeptidase regulatory-like domain-containing protein [Nanoarchaeota archaeon]
MKMMIILLMMFSVFLLAGSVLVSGSVWSSYVLDEKSGAGILEVNISAVLSLDGTIMNSTFTDTNGFFSIFVPLVNNVNEAFRFSASKTNYKNTLTQAWPNMASDFTLPMNISLGKLLSGTIAGRVTDPNMDGIGGASVFATQANVIINSTLTDSNGNYSLSLLDGTYTFLITASGHLNQTITNVVVLENTTSTQDFTPSLENIPPVIFNVDATLIASSGAVIIWQTDELANSSVFYNTLGASSLVSDSSTLVTSHLVRLSSLSPSTLYFYNVNSCDALGNCNSSSTYNFTTSAVVIDSCGDNVCSNEESCSSCSLDCGACGGGIAELTNMTRILRQGFKIMFMIEGEVYYLELVELTNTTAVIIISSEPQQATLKIGERKGFEVTGDEYYDVLVKLNNIEDDRANLTISYIHKNILPERLFDIKLELENSLIKSFDELVVIATFENFGTEPTPVTLLFTILNKNGEEVHSEEHTIIVETEEVFRRSFADVDIDLPNGKYTFILTTLYNVIVVDEFRQEFEIEKSAIVRVIEQIKIWHIFMVFIVISIFAWYFIYRFRKLRRIPKSSKGGSKK